MFTDSFLSLLKPDPSDKYDLRERTGRGFAVTVWPSGTITFIFFYYFDGRKRRMTLGQYPYMSLKKAKRLHYEALEKLENGIDPALRKQLRRIDTMKKLYATTTE